MKVWIPKLFLIFGATCLISIEAFASSKYVGTITRASGEVNILTRPKTKPSGKGPWVKFEDKYYKVKKAKVGFKLKNSNIVQSYTNGKAMIVFANGDHINVGPGTSYQMDWDESGKSKTTVLKMLYGNVRGVISPKGPRKKMRVQTKSAVAGVRGTDFSISHVGTKTEVHVLRGKVEVQHKHKKAKPVQVTAGFAGHVDTKDLEPEKTDSSKKEVAKMDAKPTPILKKISKEKLIDIQKISTIEKTAVESESLAEAEQVTKELEKLEHQAKLSVIEDIKTYDPEQGKKVEEAHKAGKLEIHEINTSTVSKLFKEAPVEDKSKAFDSDVFEGIDDEVYNKYFKEHL